MKYANCIFDLYGTLVDIHTDEEDPRLWEKMAEHFRGLGAEYRPEELRESYFRGIRDQEQRAASLPGQDSLSHPEIQIEEVFRRMFWERGLDVKWDQIVFTAQRFRGLSTEYIRLYDGAKELLRGLREIGCGVYLLSNAQRVFTQPELQALGLEECFDGIYLSSDYGCKKPDPRFFQRLLREHSISPDRAIMIGNDGECDIQGAKAVGLSTLYIQSNLSSQGPLPEADYVLERMNLWKVQNILIGS